MFLLSTFIISVLVQVSTSESTLESGCKGAGVFAHPEDCTQFLICAEDEARIFVAETVPCPEGYSFSTSGKTCVRSEKCQPASMAPTGREPRATVGGACKVSGPYCEGCDRLVVCANLGERGLTALTNVSCSEIDTDMSCDKASCTSVPPTQPCEGSDKAGSFRCLQPGFFPDPYDCKRFHVCGSDLSHFSGECDDEFDADLGVCTSVDPDNKPAQTGDTKPAETTRQCKSPNKPCTDNVGPVPFPNYPSYYVVCIPLATKSRKSSHIYQASVAKCPARQQFNVDSLTCEFTCTGKRGRFLDPDNCLSYIECIDNKAVRKSCPENYAFDQDRKSCLPVSMVQGCPRTRVTVETTTTQPTTTSTSIVKPVTPQTITNDGFQCVTIGAFPDVTDCYKYITCSHVSRSDGVYFRMRRKQCPFLTYFNPNGYCQFGFCWN